MFLLTCFDVEIDLEEDVLLEYSVDDGKAGGDDVMNLDDKGLTDVVMVTL